MVHGNQSRLSNLTNRDDEIQVRDVSLVLNWTSKIRNLTIVNGNRDHFKLSFRNGTRDSSVTRSVSVIETVMILNGNITSIYSSYGSGIECDSGKSL
jgi:hypothetical protein